MTTTRRTRPMPGTTPQQTLWTNQVFDKRGKMATDPDTYSSQKAAKEEGMTSTIESRAQEMADLLNPNDGKPHPYIVDVFRKWLQAERDRALDDAATIPEKYGNGATAREIRAKKSSSCRTLHSQSEVTPQGEDWRPIETAPRDMSNIIVWNGNEQRVAYWDTDYGCFCLPELSGEAPELIPHPTHWMPMSPPPKPTSNA